MKKLILPLSLVVLGLTAMTPIASAQRYEATVRAPQPAIVVTRGVPGRAAADLDRLNRQVREVRHEIRALGGGRRIRYQFERVVRATDFLNSEFRRGNMRGRELRLRADEVRAELNRIRRDLRFRNDGPRGSW